MSAASKFSKNIFSRGFVFFERGHGIEETIRDTAALENLAHWNQTYFGDYNVWCDTRSNYATSRDNQHGVAFLGLGINPYDGCNSNEALAENLFQALKVGRRAFYDYLHQITGAFVVLFRENEDVHILQDTAATKTVFYNTKPSQPLVVTSHENIAAKILKLRADPKSKAVMRNAEYKRDPSRYLPGMMTHFEGLYPLTANCELRFKSRQPRRFFPHGPQERITFSESLVISTTTLLKKQAQLLADLNRPLRLAASAGRDSRVSAATFAGLDNLRFFSFFRPGRQSFEEDIRVAKDVAEASGTPIDFFDLGDYSATGFSSAFQMHSPDGIWLNAARCYLTEFEPDAIHVRSTVSEIGRVFYKNRPSSVASPETLAQSYTHTKFAKNKLVIDALSDFVEAARFDTKHFYNYSHYDMFYWEHRNSKWQNILCMEAEMATDVFIPFNNRKLILDFVALPLEDRQSARLHEAICVEACPALENIEFIS